MPHVNERDVDCVGDYYTDDQVAELLGISLGRLRNKALRGQPVAAAHRATGMPASLVAVRGPA